MKIEIVLLDSDTEKTPSEITVEQKQQINQTDARTVPKPTTRLSKTTPSPISTASQNAFNQNSDTAVDFARKAVNSSKQTVQMNKAIVPEDEFSLFGKHIATITSSKGTSCTR